MVECCEVKEHDSKCDMFYYVGIHACDNPGQTPKDEIYTHLNFFLASSFISVTCLKTDVNRSVK